MSTSLRLPTGWCFPFYLFFHIFPFFFGKKTTFQIPNGSRRFVWVFRPGHQKPATLVFGSGGRALAGDAIGPSKGQDPPESGSHVFFF